jgi:hypothetical protein
MKKGAPFFGRSFLVAQRRLHTSPPTTAIAALTAAVPAVSRSLSLMATAIAAAKITREATHQGLPWNWNSTATTTKIAAVAFKDRLDAHRLAHCGMFYASSTVKIIAA